MSQFNDTLNKKAVALSYDDDDRAAAPVIVASGMGHMAEKIVEVATLLTQLELGSQIPEELYQAVVDIYVYFLKFADKKKKTEKGEVSRQEEGQVSE